MMLREANRRACERVATVGATRDAGDPESADPLALTLALSDFDIPLRDAADLMVLLAEEGVRRLDRGEPTRSVLTTLVLEVLLTGLLYERATP